MGVEPCTNPNCKSCGQPHPNCKCQQFADGGEVEPTWENTTPIESAAPAKAAAEEPTWENTTPIAGGADEPTWENTTPVEPTWETTTGKYDTSLQKIGAGLEGVAKGIAGPLATFGELALSKAGVPGLSAEDIAGRAEANPGIAGLGETAGLVGSAFIPGGQAKVAAQVASKAAQLLKIEKAATWAAKLGAGALKGAIETGLFQVSDNASKALLGQGDPNDALAARLADGVGTVGLLGGLFGAAGGGINKALTTAGVEKAGTALHSWLSGLGETAKGIDPEKSLARYMNEKAYDNGVKWYNAHIGKIAVAVGSTSSAYKDFMEGVRSGDIEGGAENALKDFATGAAFSFGMSKISKVGAAAILKGLSNGEMNPRSLFQLLDYGNKLDAGQNKIVKGIDNLFLSGGQQLFDKYDFDKHGWTLDQYVGDGGISQNIDDTMVEQNQDEHPKNYAEGGEVKKDRASEREHTTLHEGNEAFATNFPEQNVLLNTARGRVSNYLTNLRPKKDAPKLAFDMDPDQGPQMKSYKKALDIANQPLSILDKIKTGKIEPEYVKHLNSMYPEVLTALQKQATDRITKAQIKGEKPDYKIRQGLSLLLGTPLSSEFRPQNIQAAQAVFQAQKQAAQPQGGPAPKRKTSSLTKSDDSFLTKSQSLVSRSQRQ